MSDDDLVSRPSYQVQLRWELPVTPTVENVYGMLQLGGDLWSVRLHERVTEDDGSQTASLSFLVEGSHVAELRKEASLPLYYGNVVVAHLEWLIDECEATPEPELDETEAPFLGTCPGCHQEKYHMKGCFHV